MNPTDEFVIAQLAEANPAPEGLVPGATERAEAERVLRRLLDDPPAPRRRHPGSGILVLIASVLVVLVVAAVVLRTGGSSTPASHPSGGARITLRAEATSQTPRVTAGAMSREVALLRRRLASLGAGFTVAQSGTTSIVVTAPSGSAAQRGRIDALITQPAQLRFYDWEANVLTPNGKTVSSQLSTQNATAVSVSQGRDSGPGYPGAGSSSLYQAVSLATKQPPAPAGRFLSRLGPEYYAFGAPGSRACAAAAAVEGAAGPPAGQCLLAGPLDPGRSVSRSQAIAELAAQLPAGVTPSDGQVLAVPQGTLVVQAEPLRSGARVSIVSPAAQFFVMHDHVALSGADITHPKAGTDQSAAPDVTFGFTGSGRAAFQRATRAIAHRGAEVSPNGLTLNQHFAVAVDNRLVTVPQIDFRQYPDGIIGANGADITGGLDAPAARDLATQLRYGALPLALRVVN